MLESRDTRHTCFLIDRTLGLDPGSLPSALSAWELAQVTTILLTHQHYTTFRTHLDVYRLPEILAAVHGHLLNCSVYPDLTEPLISDLFGGPAPSNRTPDARIGAPLPGVRPPSPRLPDRGDR